MAQSIQVSWVAGGGGGQQTVQYRVVGSSTWGGDAIVGASVTSHTFNGLADNTVYEFRVTNQCAGGIPTASTNIPTAAGLTCPVVSVNGTTNSITYSFNHLGANVTRYVVELLDSGGVNVVASKTHNSPSGVVSDTFTGVSSGNYFVRVRVFAGQSQEFNTICANTPTSVSQANCTAPTSVTATVIST